MFSSFWFCHYFFSGRPGAKSCNYLYSFLISVHVYLSIFLSFFLFQGCEISMDCDDGEGRSLCFEKSCRKDVPCNKDNDCFFYGTDTFRFIIVIFISISSAIPSENGVPWKWILIPYPYLSHLWCFKLVSIFFSVLSLKWGKCLAW